MKKNQKKHNTEVRLSFSDFHLASTLPCLCRNGKKPFSKFILSKTTAKSSPQTVSWVQMCIT